MVLLSRLLAVPRGAFAALLCFLFSPIAFTAEAPPRIDFGKQIRPILAERCYECHGPESQEGSLRLDRRADAQRGGDSGIIIQPGAAATSRLVEVLESDNEDERMPLGKKPLKPAEIDLIKRWIAEGAELPDAWSGDAAAAQKAHWSFRPPRSPPLPALRSYDGIQNPIDLWVAARLEQAGLSFSREADRHTLIRRLYLDLLGLLPTPEQADQFAADSRPDAYERLVDELLGSPQYGVRWARRWLDLARYADTNGYEKDRPRSIWPYRDWVVRALNEDIPFDRFSVQQLAGDLLPSPSLDDRLATGFHRNTMVNEEGGIDPLEFRYHAIVDRANTTGTVWLGLTVGCAQCHSHKYDPLQQTEYYQLLAFLNQCDELDMPVPDEAVDTRRRELEQQIGKLEAELPQHFPLPEASGESATVTREEWVEKRFQQWLAEESAAAVRWQVLRPAEATSNLPLLTVLEDDSILASGDQTKSDIYQLRFPATLQNVTAIRLEALPHESLPLHGPGRAYYEGPKGDFFLSEFRVSSGDEKLAIATASHSYSKLSIGSGDHGASLTFDGNTTTGWSTSGREGEPHAAVFTFAKPVDLTGDCRSRWFLKGTFPAGWAGSEFPWRPRPPLQVLADTLRISKPCSPSPRTSGPKKTGSSCLRGFSKWHQSLRRHAGKSRSCAPGCPSQPLRSSCANGPTNTSVKRTGIIGASTCNPRTW